MKLLGTKVPGIKIPRTKVVTKEEFNHEVHGVSQSKVLYYNLCIPIAQRDKN